MGSAAINGYPAGQAPFAASARPVQKLAALLLADSSAAGDLANSLGIPLAERYLVIVVRIPGLSLVPEDKRREEVVEAMLIHRQLAIASEAPDELVALLPGDGADPSHTVDAAGHGALGLARAFAEMLELPCAVGAATGPTGDLVKAVALARRVSRVAPVEAIPRRVHTTDDVFVELGVTQLPQVELWMHGLVQRLSTGPDLIVTLDAYYQNDMNRLNTAGALFIHPRTLDYRLQRVRELVEIDPGSTRGVRVLSAAVARALAGT